MPDIGVCYVTRTPRYDRYVVTSDDGGPLLWHGGAKNPVGQRITYTAKIQNHGDTAEAFGFTISLDGVVLRSGSASLASLSSQTFSVTAPNTGTRQKLTVTVTPEDTVHDPAINDSLTIDTDAFAVRFVVDPYVYLFYQVYKTTYTSPNGTLAFEDWAQSQVAKLNSIMEARGATTRIFLDGCDPAPYNLYTRSYPDSSGHDATFIAYLAYLDPANGLLNKYDWLTVALLGRSIGLSYDAFYSVDATNNPVSHLTYAPPTSFVYYGLGANPGMSEFDKNAMNQSAKFRRGFIGEYQYDIPESLSVKIFDSAAKPLANYKVDVFQSTTSGGLTEAPIFTGRTDANGVMLLPNKNVSRRDTPTGHHLKPNPFGQIDVNGGNGLLHFRVYTPTRYVFGWLPLSRVNTAFWAGATKRAVMPVVAYRYTTAIGSVPTQQSVSVDQGTAVTGNFTINTGVTQALVSASVVQGAQYMTLAKTEGTSPLRIKYTVDTTTLVKGQTYTFDVILHDWSQGTADAHFLLNVTIK